MDGVQEILPGYDRPAEKLLAHGRRGDRAYMVEVRPGMTEGQYLGIMVRAWGQGKDTLASGEPHFYSRRVDAENAGLRWVETGRR
jgi:hypothetical protein